MAGNDDLHPLLRNINKTLASLREDVKQLTGEVKKIPEVLEEGFKSLRDAIHENIQAQAELKLMEHMMEVTSVEPQIEAEREQIEDVQESLVDRIGQINERYEKKHQELDEKTKKRIRDLGSHIFEIEEKEFEANIEEPFTTQVTPVWADLQGHNHKTNEERETKLRTTTETVVTDIDKYIERQDELVEQIESHLFDPATVPIETTEKTEVQLPYYIIEYQSQGVQERIVIPPSEIQMVDESDDWSSVQVVPIEGTNDIIPNTREIDHRQATEHSIPQQQLIKELDDYTESSKLGIGFQDAMSDSMPGQVPLTTEGGEH